MTTDLIKSYVWHGGQCYFVSTIDRDSSALYGARFSETIVWEVDFVTDKRGMIISQTSDQEGSIREHMRQVAAIHETGKPIE